MMRQYLEMKEEHSDCLLLFRLGDFYELFFDDAKTAARELEITLTGRDCGLKERAPMCGVPFHAADSYIAKLIDKGYKVAICEQLQDPSEAKGLVDRGIVRIITPGTVADNAMIPEDENNYLLVLAEVKNALGVAYADVSTGSFFVEMAESTQDLLQILARIKPKEVVLSMDDETHQKDIAVYSKNILISRYPSWAFEPKAARDILLKHFGLTNLDVFQLEDFPAGISACGVLIQYLLETQKNALNHIKKIQRIQKMQFMAIDPFTHRNLELTETMREKNKRGSLLWLLDKTKTSMGSRLLRTFIEQPLLSKQEIELRLDAVDELKNSFAMRSDLRDALSHVYDIERLLSRLSYMTLDGRHTVSLRQSLEPLPAVKALLESASSRLLAQCGKELDPLEELCQYLNAAIADNPPLGVKEGGIIKDGFHPEVDKLRSASKNGKDWLLDMEAREREATGIRNLKIGYNKVFGYYIEVTKSNLDLVPYSYTRKQTLTGCERFITKELKDLEDTILSAQDKCNKLEYELFTQIRSKIAQYIEPLQKNAKLIALADVLQSFAQAAYDYGYVKPKINTQGVLDIRNGRHPVVERTVGQEFVPNDSYLDNQKNQLLVITGPNMAGKSTFMRQTGLIAIMAHMGSFVPASSANIPLLDRVFTRVGASDDLASGQSTFMVEMNELAGILHNATDKSLLILDEIGRGTSTLDGLSIAWATIEYITQHIGSKTLFATHYHELTDLEGIVPGLQNYCVTIKELDKNIIFLHKIKRGGTDRSFGIEVARLAGLPEELLTRAKALLTGLEQQTGVSLDKIETPEEPVTAETKNLEGEKLIQLLRNIDVNALTPLEALTVLNDLVQKVQ